MPFDYIAVAGSGKVVPANQVNHTSWVTVVTLTDRPNSVRKRSVIELFGCHFALLTVVVGAFVIGLSQISSIFSFKKSYETIVGFNPECFVVVYTLNN